jgi:hypothetical protein
MSDQYETLVAPTDATNGIKLPRIASSASEIRAHQTEGAEDTSAKASFDYEAAAQRAPGEF